VVLQGRQPSFYLLTPEEKADILANYGVDFVVTETFDEALSEVSADDFVLRLVNHLEPHSLWVGPDFALGYNREGNVPFLRAKGLEFGFEVHIVEPMRMNGEIISSSRVREALRSGDVGRAASYLGRPFEIPGEVIKGSGRGHQLGFPTANLSIWEERAYPRQGVYACYAMVDGSWSQAVANVGSRPTFEPDLGDRIPVVETYLMDFAESDLYGHQLKLQFMKRLRDEQHFENPEALREQIQLDLNQARHALEEFQPDQEF
jgi:riboflavin kinase/FMN adenylyltransferase